MLSPYPGPAPTSPTESVYIDASYAHEGTIARTTTSLLLTRRSISWHIYINAAISFSMLLTSGGTSTSGNVANAIYHTLKCLADIMDEAAEAYSFRQASFNNTLFAEVNHGEFVTKSPFGSISFDQFSTQGRMYEVNQEGSIQHKLPMWMWHVHARPVHAINLTVTRFQLMYSGEDCSADHMTVSEPDRVIGHYCGNKQPWSVESCSNRMKIIMGLVSPGHVVVQILYQIIDKPPEKCPTGPYIHHTVNRGKFIIRRPPFLDNPLFHKHSISWYIIVGRLESIDIAVKNYSFLIVYYGRFPKNIFRASPHSVIRGYIKYKIVGFHATIVMQFLDSSVQQVGIEFLVNNKTYNPFITHCGLTVTTNNSRNTYHIEAKPHYVDYSGKDPRTTPIYCLAAFQAEVPLRIEIERIQFASNDSDDECLDSGLVIYDENQEGLEIFQPQIGPLCGAEMQRRLQFTPQRIINTRGSSNFHPVGFNSSQVIKFVFIAFYSYAENKGLFKANIVRDWKCVGFFQPCTYDGKPPESPKTGDVTAPGSILSFVINEVGGETAVSIYVELNPLICLMFQLFPVRQRYLTHCMISFSSYERSYSNTQIYFLEAYTTELYYSTGYTVQCLGCYDRLLLFNTTHSTWTTLVGEHSRIYHGANDLLFFSNSVIAPIAARLFISKDIFLADVLKPNRLFNVGSEAAILGLPWATGFYRLTFHRRLSLIYRQNMLCFSPKCFFIQRPISTSHNCSLNFVVSYFRQGKPYHMWHLNEEYQSLAWLSKPETLFTIGIDFEVTGMYSGCSGSHAPQPVKLYFLHLWNHSLSEAQHVYKGMGVDCKVKVDKCHFGKCYHFRQPSLRQQVTWNNQATSCRRLNRTLTRLRDMEESNWLRSLVNMNEQNYVPQYISVFLDLYKTQVGSFTLMS